MLIKAWKNSEETIQSDLRTGWWENTQRHYRDTFSCMFHSQTLSIFWGKHRQRKLLSLIPHICQLKEGTLKLTLLLAACCSVSPFCTDKIHLFQINWSSHFFFFLFFIELLFIFIGVKLLYNNIRVFKIYFDLIVFIWTFKVQHTISIFSYTFSFFCISFLQSTDFSYQ